MIEQTFICDKCGRRYPIVDNLSYEKSYEIPEGERTDPSVKERFAFIGHCHLCDRNIQEAISKIDYRLWK